ncbi:MAG TPA: shikimate kinase [Syntrophomonas sp.]|jgi:shikimate kinase|nr:shikimate kinase [Syntrophomonas sp.]HCF70497.1 shikimate kinase [Syntrophomonas sp.]
MAKNIVLIGFMGTGKSSAGYRLAQKLKREFIDTDREIERITGMPISQLFKLHGEIRFRSEEELVAKKLQTRTNMVIATGGGIILNPNNIKYLKENGILICLDASPEDIFSRVSRKKGARPLLRNHFSIEGIRKLIEDRESLYSCADFRVDTSGREINEVVDDIIKFIRRSKEKKQ